jgi:hypothetical protein
MGPSARTQDQSGIDFGQDNDDQFLNKEASLLLCDAMRCRVEDGNATVTAENWEDSHGDSLPADRFWNIASECNIAADDEGPCMGIELNIWERAKVHIVIIIIIVIIKVMDIFSIDIMIFKFCTGPALHSAHVGGR